MDSDTLLDKITVYFKQHQEKAFILKAFLLIFFILWMREYLPAILIFYLFILLPIFVVPIALALSAYSGDSLKDIITRNITFIPAPYSERKGKSGELAIVTYSLVFINVGICDFVAIDFYV